MKPANVMLTLDGNAKVTDFGLAQARAMAGGEALPLAEEGQSILVGYGGMTPAYCSPEQARRQPLGRKTDIWSWAVSVLQVFNGAVTWLTGAAASGALADYLHRGAVDRRIPAMPADLADLLSHCFQTRPNDRPANMAEVAAALLEIYQREVGQPYPHAAPRPAEVLAATLNNRALSLYDLGKIEEAKQVWVQALEADAQHLEATYNQGMILWRQAKLTDDALVYRLEEVRATQRDQWQPVYLLALVHLERGDKDTALRFLEEAAQRAPAETEAQALWEQAQLGALLPGISISHEHELRFRGVTSLSAGGRFACTVSDRATTVRVWEVATGKCLRTFQEQHMGIVHSVSLSADGKVALSGSRDHTMRVWEVATGRCLRTFPHPNTVDSVSLSADGKVALSQAGHTARVWEVATGECLRDIPHSNLTDAHLSADGRVALTGSHDEMIVREIATGEFLRVFRKHMLERSPPASLSADGHWALSVSRHNWTGRLWEVATGRCLRTFYESMSPVMSEDGSAILSQSKDGTVQVWNITPQTFLAPAQLSQIMSQKDLLHIEDQARTLLLQAEDALGKARFAVALDLMEQVRVLPGWERSPKSQEIWTKLLPHCPKARFRTGWLAKTFQAYRHGVLSVSLSADGRLALFFGDDGKLRLWEVASGRCLRIFQHTGGSISTCLLSADGRLALAASSDDNMQLWEVATGRCLHTFWERRPLSISLSADGKIVLSGDPYEIQMWEGITGRRLHRLRPNEQATGTYGTPPLSLSADSRIALSGSGDGTVKVWEVATGRCLHIFQGHTNSVSAVSLSADGHWDLSGSHDGTVRLWELDWELEARDPINWDEGALPTLETFLSSHTPYAEKVRSYAGVALTEQEIQQALTRRGKPSWTEQDFQDLICQLQYAGYGWLRPEGVRHQLEVMATAWPGRPRGTDGQMDQERKPASWWGRLFRTR